MTRILIVDDDRLILGGLARGLEERGFEVFSTDTGEAAVTLADSAQPDLVLMDIGLPGIAGTEAACKIQAKLNVPVIFLSALDDPDTVRAAITAGSLSYLVKPITIKQLVPVIENALARSCDMSRLRAAEENLSTALMQSRDISIAIGMLMERHAVTAEEGFELLRAHSRRARSKTTDVAKDVIAGTLQLAPEAR
jgi:AmiR/NasT family two-component response regulator